MPKNNGLGHNSKEPMSEEDASALTIHHQLKILEGQRKLDALLVDVKAARGVVNSSFKRMTADLQFTRQEFEREVIAKLNMTPAEYAASERKRDRLHRLAGLKENEQLDLLDHLADTVDDEMAAEAEGYLAGRRADDPTPREGISPIMHPAWVRGYHRGQDVNAQGLARADQIIAARGAPKGELQAEEPGDQENALDPEDLDEAARKLRRDGWTQPTTGEAAFEGASA